MRFTTTDSPGKGPCCVQTVGTNVPARNEATTSSLPNYFDRRTLPPSAFLSTAAHSRVFSGPEPQPSPKPLSSPLS
jgi:hypothetical protein